MCYGSTGNCNRSYFGKRSTKGSRRPSVVSKGTSNGDAPSRCYGNLGNVRRAHLLRRSFASKKTFPLSGSSRVVCAIRPLPGVASGAVNFQSYVCFMLMNGDTWKSFSNLRQTRATVCSAELDAARTKMSSTCPDLIRAYTISGMSQDGRFYRCFLKQIFDFLSIRKQTCCKTLATHLFFHS